MNDATSDEPPLMPALILAGGLATRLRPLTTDTPKALIDVAGRPFLWRQLRLLERSGIRKVVVAAGYLGESIRQRFGDGSQEFDLSLEYSFDGPTPLGTAGAVRHALPLLPERFFVIYGDSYLLCDFRAVETAFRKSEALGLMTVYRNDGRFDASNVEYDGERIVRYDKRLRTPSMHHIDYGLSAFHRDAFASITEAVSCDLVRIYQELLTRSALAAFEVHERFYEIGSPEGLRETIDFFTREGPG
jgi:NDP-sugar pyrophosphorylase family protein